MLSVETAIEKILSEIEPLGVERRDILSSLGRILAEDITTSRSNPPWDNSAMDGYALRCADTRGATPEKPSQLKVIYDLPAGSVPLRPIEKGEAVRIMTGAPVPEGADGVVMVEYTEKREGLVLVKKEVAPGENIRKKGEDFKEGDVVIEKGTLIRAFEVSMLATAGRPFVPVYQTPRVAVISTGDELVDIEESPSGGRIPDANGYALCAMVRECGCTPVHIGIARDNPEDLRSKLESAVSSDCIITSGGVSVGDYDLVKDVLRDMGSEMKFWKVAIKPGKPLAFGLIQGRPAFGLPGNPVSSIMAFEQFVRPALFRLSGRKEVFRRTFDAVLTGDVKKKPGRMNFLRGVMEYRDGRFYVTPLEGQGSGMISTLVRCNAYIVLPPESTGAKKGEVVKAQPVDWSLFYGGRPFL